MARKTTTSTAVKQAWINRNYQRYAVSFRLIEDKELIDYIEAHKNQGISNLFKEGIRALITQEKK